MATIKNTIQTNFSSKGAKKVKDDTESVGRAQTRMGQASASAGRSFAAQSQGLGGLVGAYAGAAATVFALEAAFNALSKAAEAEMIVKGTNALAAAVGQQGPKILESIQEIAQGQLTLEEAANAANLALSSSFSADKIEKLTEVALGASRALGRNLTDAMQRIVRGAAKMEPELLDELGIFVRIDPAVERYANSLNKATSEISDFERRQAFLNAIIEEGTRKFGDIDVTSDSAQKSLEQLSVQINKLAKDFGQLLLKVLIPIVDFFNDNFGNVLVLFLGILTLVFAKAGQIMGGFVSKGLKDLSSFSIGLADSTKDMKKFEAASTQLQKSYAADRKSTMGKQGFNPRIAERSAEQTASLSNALKDQREGSLQSVAAIDKNNKVLKENQGLLTKGSARYQFLTKRINANNVALAAGGRAAGLFAKTATGLTAVVRGLSFAFGILGSIVNVAFMGLAVAQLAGTFFDKDFITIIKDLITGLNAEMREVNKGFAAMVVAAAGGTKALNDLLKRAGASDEELKGAGDRINELRENLTALGTGSDLVIAARIDEQALQESIPANITTEALAGRGKFDTSQFTMGDADGVRDMFDVDAIKGLQMYGDNLPKIVKAVELLNKVNNEEDDGVAGLLRVTHAEMRASDELADKVHNVKSALQALAEARTMISAGEGNNTRDQAARQGLLVDESVINKKLTGIVRAKLAAEQAKAVHDKEVIENLRKELALREQLQKVFDQPGGAEAAGLISGIAEAAGRSTAEVVKSMQNPLVNLNGEIRIFGELIKKTADGNSIFSTQTVQVQDLLTAYAAADSTLDMLLTDFRAGAIDSTKLDSGLSGVATQLAEIVKLGKESDPLYAQLKLRAEIIEELNVRLKRQEAIVKAISAAFSTEMKAVDTAFSSGALDSDGKAALNSTQKLINQRQILIDQQNEVDNTIFQTQLPPAEMMAKMTPAEQAAATKFAADQEEMLKANEKTRKSAAGTALKLLGTMQQQVESEKKKEVQLNKQLALLTEQIALQRSITFEKLREIKIAEQAEGRQKDIKNAEIILDLEKAQNVQQKEMADFNKQVTAEINKQNIFRQEAINLERQVAAEAALAAKERAKDLQEGVLDTAVAQGGDTQLAQRQALIDMEKNLAIDRVTEQKTILQEEFDLAQQKRTDVNNEMSDRQAQLNKEITALNNEFTQENDLIALRQANERQAIKDESTNIKADAAIAKQQLTQQKIDIASRTALAKINKAQVDRQSALARVNIEFVKLFADEIRNLNKVVEKITGQGAVLAFSGDSATILEDLITDLETTQSDNYAKGLKVLEEQETSLGNQIKDIDKIAKAQVALNDTRLANLVEQQGLQDALVAQQQANTMLQLVNEREILQAKLDGSGAIDAAEASTLAGKLAALDDEIHGAEMVALVQTQAAEANLRQKNEEKRINDELNARKLKGLNDELSALGNQEVIAHELQNIARDNLKVLAMEKMSRDESLKVSEHALEIEKLTLDIANNLTDQLINEKKVRQEILAIENQLLTAQAEGAAIAAKAGAARSATEDQIKVQNFIADNRIAGAAAAAVESNLKFKSLEQERQVIQAKIEESKRTAKVASEAAAAALSIEQEISDLAVKRLTEEKDFVMSALELEEEKLNNSRIELTAATETNKKQIAVLELQKTAAATAVRLAAENRQNEYKLLQAKNAFLISEIAASKADIAARKDLAVQKDPDMDTTNIDALLASTELTTELKAQNTALAAQELLVVQIGNAQIAAAKQQFDDRIELLGLENDLNDTRIANIDSEIVRQSELTMLQLSAIQDKIDAEKANLALAGQLAAANSAVETQQNQNKLAELEAQKEALIDQANIYNTQLINSIKAENFAIEDTIKGLTAQKVALEAQVDLQKAKLDLSVKEAELALQAGARQQVIKAQEHILELAKMQNAEAEKAAAHTQRMLEQQNTLFELEMQIANVKRETASIMEETARNSANVDKQIELQNFIQENQLKGTAAAIAQYDLKRETNMQEQTLLDRQIEESQRLATQEQDNIRAADGLRIRKQEADIAALETSKTIVRQEAALEIQKLVNQLRALEDAKTLNAQRKKILELEAKVAKDGITAAAEKTKLDLEVLKETNNTVIAQIEGAKQRARIEAAVLKAGNPMADISLIDAQIKGATEVVKQLTTQNGLLDDQIAIVDKITALEIKKIDDNLKTQLKLIDLDNKRISQEQDGIATSIEQTQELRDLKIASIDAEISRIKEAGELEGQITLSNIRLSQAEADSKIAALEQQKQALIDQARLSGVELVNAVRDEIVAQKDKTRELDKQIELLKAQAKVNAMVRASELKAVQTQNSQNTVKRDLTFQKASLTLARQKADINAKDRATALDMFKMNQKIAQQQSDLSMAAASTSAAGAQAGIQANAAKETAALQNKLDRSILNQRDTVALQVKLAEVNLKAALASAGVKANLAKKERDAAMEALDRREALLTEELKAQGAALQEERDLFIEQMKIVEQEEALVREKMKQDILQMSRDKQNLTALEQLALKKNDADTKQRQFELELLKKQYVLLRDQRASKMALLAEEARITGAEMPTQTETDRKLDQGIRDMIKQLDINIGKESQVGSLKGDDIKADFASQRAIMGERQKDLISEYNSVLDLQRLKQDGRNLELAEFDKLAVKQVETYLKNLESLGLEREMVEQNFVAKMQAAGMEAQAAKDLFAITKERLEYQLTAEAKLKDMVEALITNINDGLGNAINKVFDNIAEGKSIKDGLGDIFADTFENIRKTVLQKTLIEPAKDAFRGLVGNLIPGLGLNEEKGADNAKVIDGALLTTSGSAGGPSPAEKMKEDVEKKGMGFFDGFKEKAMNVFGSMKEGIGKFGTTALDTFKGLGGSLGNIFSSVTSGLGSLFGGGGAGGGGGLMSSIMGMFGGGGGAAGGGGGFMSSIMGMFGGAATGGLVGMTGVRNMAAGGQVNALRDRVPAMLEPGEFVMRKPAVKSIGAGNLGQMNATGAGGMGNVQFNIVNEGSPKQAEQQGQPRLDADKIVVDVVMRDLASNGPIRQAMRNG